MRKKRVTLCGVWVSGAGGNFGMCCCLLTDAVGRKVDSNAIRLFVMP